MPRSLLRSSRASATSFFGGRGWGLDIGFLGHPAVSAESRLAQSAGGDPKCYYARVMKAWRTLDRTCPRATCTGATVRVVRLATPPVARIVPAGVFDAFGGCESDELEWRAREGSWDASAPLHGAGPAPLVLVTPPAAA